MFRRRRLIPWPSTRSMLHAECFRHGIVERRIGDSETQQLGVRLKRKLMKTVEALLVKENAGANRLMAGDGGGVFGTARCSAAAFRLLRERKPAVATRVDSKYQADVDTKVLDNRLARFHRLLRCAGGIFESLCGTLETLHAALS